MLERRELDVMNNGTDEEEDAHYIDAETLFESYMDRDSGAWSIRRITASPPSTPEGETTE
jgi:hypothetical protein